MQGILMEDQASGRGESRRRIRILLWWAGLLALLLGLFFGVHRLGIASVNRLTAGEPGSKMRADYQPWLFANFAPVGGAILEAVQEEDGINPDVAELAHGVYWVGDDEEPLAAALITPTPTLPPATATPMEIPDTATPTKTAYVFIPTKTSKPPKATKKPKATAAPTSTATNTPTPTDTPIPPTDTFTPNPAATDTPVPPTDTPIPAPFDCSTIFKVGGGVGTDSRFWTISNTSGSSVSMTKFTVKWDETTGTIVSWINVGAKPDESGSNSSGTASVNGTWSILSGGTLGITVKFSAIPTGVSSTAIVNGCSK